MIPCGRCPYTSYAVSKLTDEERGELMAINANAIAWLEKTQRDCERELRALRKHIKCRKFVQSMYDENKPVSTAILALKVRQVGRGERVHCGVVVFPVSVMIGRNGIIRERETCPPSSYPTPEPGYGAGRVTALDAAAPKDV